MTGLWTRLAFGFLILAIPAKVSPAQPPPPESQTDLAAARDAADRITVPVMVNDSGPFAFVVDTGADRTVISRELAAELALPAGPPALLSATSGVEMEQTGVVDTLKVGRRTVRQIHAPLLGRDNLGAAGMLGIDSLAGQSVVLDFHHQRVTVTASRREVDEPGVIVHAKSRYGQLILVDARVGGIPIYAILDSGAQNTVANTTLARLLALRRRNAVLATPSEVISVTGGRTPAEFMILPTMALGSITLENVPVAFADLYTFARFDLSKQPAMLLGMDVLRAFDSVSIDFGRKAVSFHMR